MFYTAINEIQRRWVLVFKVSLVNMESQAREQASGRAPRKLNKVFGYNKEYNQLYWIELNTLKERSVHLAALPFRGSWCSPTDDSLIFTGGDLPPDNVSAEVLKVDIRKDFAVLEMAFMLTPRSGHGIASDGVYAYAIGGRRGNDRGNLSSCERYHIALDKWEAIPPLEQRVARFCPVIFHNELYVIGGSVGRASRGIGGPIALPSGFTFNVERSGSETIQVLNLASLEWRTLQVRLPSKGHLPCFTIGQDKLCFLKTFDVFSLEIDGIVKVGKVVYDDIYFHGAEPCTYWNSVLYCSTTDQRIDKYPLRLTI